MKTLVLSPTVITWCSMGCRAQTGDFLYTGSETTITLQPGLYDITAYGARGGSCNGYLGGGGAERKAQFNFATTVSLTLIVGGAGANGRYPGSGGGGGGSLVVNGTTPLDVAGGGGYTGGNGGDSQPNSSIQAIGEGGAGGSFYIDLSAVAIITEVSGVASPDDSPNGEIIIIAVPPPPAIGITTVNSLPAVTWPATGTNFTLQMTTNLTSGNWVTFTDGIPFNGNPFFGLEITNVPQPPISGCIKHSGASWA